MSWMDVLFVSVLLFITTPFSSAVAEKEAANAVTKSKSDLTRVLNSTFRDEVFGEDDEPEEIETMVPEIKLSTSPSLCKCPKKHHHHRGVNATKIKTRHFHVQSKFTKRDVEELNVILNAEYLEAEFFLHAGYGYGLDYFNGTSLSISGPSPIGPVKGQIGKFTEHIAREFGLQALGHIREVQTKIGKKAIARPQIDLSRKVWSELFNKAFETELQPSFDPYMSSNHFLLAAYMLPYVSLTAYVGLNMHVEGSSARELVAGLASVKAAQDASIRTVLYQRRRQQVAHYSNISVGVFTATLSALRTKLDRANVTVVNPATGSFILPTTVDEGVLVSGKDTPDNLLTGNIIPVNENSLYIGRTPEQMLQVLYGTGNVSIPGLFFPEGANGKFATKYFVASM